MEQNRVGARTIEFKSRPRIISAASVAGKKESEGPLSKHFDKVYKDPRIGKKTFEQGESELQRVACVTAISKASLTPQDIQLLAGGDLLNQCMATAVGIETLGIPFLGLYGACSTMSESLLLCAAFLDGGFAGTALAVTSSHYCSAERQYRFPLEYGSQRTQNAQWTVTAGGAAVLSSSGEAMARISHGCVGRIVDLGVTDSANMGAAMAPAAADTIANFLRDTGTSPEDYSLILTGDLGMVGSALLKDLLSLEDIDIEGVHNDCGLIIFDCKKQDTHSGGSGCGCAAAVLCSKILPELSRGALKKILFIATGALTSPTTSQQGCAVLGVAHLICIEAPDAKGGE